MGLRVTSVASVLAAIAVVGCEGLPWDGGESGAAAEPGSSGRAAVGPGEVPEPARAERVDSRPPPMAQPVDLWLEGRVADPIDAATADQHGYVVLDLGEEWTPYLFSERGNAAEEPLPNAYRETYLTLARGEFPRDHHGDRARRDKYLELYGIMPTLGALRDRMRTTAKSTCEESVDLSPLAEFSGFLAYESNDKARRDAQTFAALERQVNELVRAAGVEDDTQLDQASLDERQARRLRDYRAMAPTVRTVRAVQERLRCEGYLEGKGRIVRGMLDWATHEALAEFERKHRVYGWGFIGGETLAALRRTAIENEREAVVRVLTERAMHALGVIEDGSTSQLPNGEQRTFKGTDGAEHAVPNLEASVRAAVVAAFGLETPDTTLAWLDGLGELDPQAERLVALTAPPLPEYYDGNMRLSVEVDRGDVWYEFPYDEQGRERPQPVELRPRQTVYTEYLGQRIPLARFGTTIGGWRSEQVDGAVMWRYKGSPVGPRIWRQIVAAPVWLPPESTPARELLRRNASGTGRDRYGLNLHETGPSYASAYGLVAAYHLKYREDANGQLIVGGDEGIRSHGSVDYMSIMRRHSHGCHRLHNHIAVRLMSFMLAHRPHRRVGQQAIGYRLPLRHEGHDYLLALDQGGYVFELEEPVVVTVLEGRIRGERRTPIEHPIPKYDVERGGYALQDGLLVSVARTGELTPLAPLDPAEGALEGAEQEAGSGVPVEPAVGQPPNPAHEQAQEQAQEQGQSALES